MGADQSMTFIFFYRAEAPGRQWDCAVDIVARTRAEADVGFAEHLHELEPNFEGMTVTVKPRVDVEATLGVFTKIFAGRMDGTFRRYKIIKATDKEGKRRKKKWIAIKYTYPRGYKDYTMFDKHYFSSREKAARWVVLDA